MRPGIRAMNVFDWETMLNGYISQFDKLGKELPVLTGAQVDEIIETIDQFYFAKLEHMLNTEWIRVRAIADKAMELYQSISADAENEADILSPHYEEVEPDDFEEPYEPSEQDLAETEVEDAMEDEPEEYE